MNCRLISNGLISLSLAILFLCSCESNETGSSDIKFQNKTWNIIESELIDYCASDVCVGYSIYEKDNSLIIGYYDKYHQLSLAKRSTDGKWTYSKLNEFVDFDNHKNITVIIDNDGLIHLCANMHASPLVYYISQSPFSIDDMVKISMIGIDENNCTYPQFMIESSKLLFHYRSGTSGNGNEIFNEYDYTTKTWDRLLDKPLFDGIGMCNAYFIGPILGADHYYHVIWCWRDTPDCATNHGLYYAYSNDLKDWYNIRGDISSIPIIPTDNKFIVDDIPAGGGLLNIGFNLGFDENKKPLIIYHKYDENDHTNIYLAQIDNENSSEWSKIKLTNWDWKWNFSGLGSIITELYLSNVWGENNHTYCVFTRTNCPNQLIDYDKYLNNVSITEYQEYPSCLNERILQNSEIVHIFTPPCYENENTKYIIRYETLNTNRDVQSEIMISPSPLYLYKLMR